jgi:carbonic anhydrase
MMFMAGLLDKSLETAKVDDKGWHDVGKGPGSVHGHFTKWHTISNLDQSVIDDVKRIRTHPLVPRRIPIYGYVYDVRSGRLNEVKAATKAGQAA